MKTRAILTLAAAASLSVLTAYAADGPMRGAKLEDRLYRYWETTAGAHDIAGAFITAAGAAGSTTNHQSVPLVAGRHYLFTLFCDVNCTNVTIRALGANNMPIPTEAETPRTRDGGAEAEIGFNAPAAGPIRLEVKINACSAATCNYEIGQFVGRPNG